MLRSLLGLVVVGGCLAFSSAALAQPAQPRPVQPDNEASPSDARPPVVKSPLQSPAQSPVQAPSVKGAVVQVCAPANCGKRQRHHRRCR